MPDQKTDFLTTPELLAIGLFILSALTFFVLLFVGILSSFWIILPVSFFLLDIGTVFYLFSTISEKPLEKVPDETHEEYENALEIDKAIKQFEEYAKGAIALEEITISPESDLYQWLFHSQKAEFLLETQTEINRSQETKQQKETFKARLEERVMGELKKSHNSGEKLKIFKESEKPVEDNKVIFNKLFKRAEEFKPLKRPIYHVKFDGSKEDVNVAFKRRNKFVLFGINPDGNCMFYPINVRTRNEMLDLIIQYIDFSPLRIAVYNRIFEEKFKEIGVDYGNGDEELKTWIEEYAEIKSKINELKRVPNDLFDKEAAFRKKIGEKIKSLISYEDNEKFAIFIKRYMQKIWFDDAITYNLCRTMNQKNPQKFRQAARFELSNTERYALIFRMGEYGCYRLIGGEVKENNVLKNDTLYAWVKDKFFHYQFKDPSGKWIKNKIEDKRLKHHFSQTMEDMDYNTFIQKLNFNQLSDSEVLDTQPLMLLTIAEKEIYGPQPYYYNYLPNGVHTSRFVELEDDEELIRAKIHENRFGLCQDQEQYDGYERRWGLYRG